MALNFVFGYMPVIFCLRLGREVIRIVVVRYIDIVSHSCLRLGIEVVRINVVGYIVGHIALQLFTYQCRLFSYIK